MDVETGRVFSPIPGSFLQEELRRIRELQGLATLSYTAGVLKTRMALNMDLAWEFSPIQGSLLQGELKEIERAAPV